MEEQKASYIIRIIEPNDNKSVASIIRTVMPEFKAEGPGFAIEDQEVDAMYEEYGQPRSIYLVLLKNQNIIGGAGIAPLLVGDPDICELKKMYFLKEARGLGMGDKIIKQLLEKAFQLNYKKCYLETLEHMTSAKKLYRRNGFKQIESAMGKTGHYGCDNFFLKDLTA